jgi:hypothetical protein
MSNEKKPKKIRSGFFGIKLTDEELNYQVENYQQLSGLSSRRGKASFVFLILAILGWMSFVGQNQSTSHALGYSLLAIVFIMTFIIFKWPKTGIIIVFIILSANALLVLADDPTKILGMLIAFYILIYVLYPVYQVEKHKAKLTKQKLNA